MAVYNVEVRYDNSQWQHLAGPFRSIDDAEEFVAEHRRDVQSVGNQHIPIEALHILQSIRDSGSPSAGQVGGYLSGGMNTSYRIV